MTTGPEAESDQRPDTRAPRAGGSQQASAAGATPLAPLQQVGEEAVGPLRLRRYVRPDGRALEMYERVDGPTAT